MKWICFFLYLLTLMLTAPAWAQSAAFASLEAPGPLDAGSEYSTIGEHSYYLHETEAGISIEQARQAFANGRFQASTTPVPGFGLTSHGAWLKFDVQNSTERAVTRRLTVKSAWLNYIDIYIIQHNQRVAHYKTGDARPLSSRQIDNRLFVFEHDFAPGTTAVYLRAQSHEPLVLPIAFSDTATAVKHDRNRSYGYGILYGIISGLLLFNLLIYISIRQQRYLFYVFYLSMYLFMDISYTGHGYLYLWQDASWWQQWSASTSVVLYATSGIFFALSFLKIKTFFPAIYSKTIRFCIFLCAMQLLFILLDMEKTSVAIALLYVMFFSVFTFYYAIISFNKGHNDAIYYLIATFATLIGAAVTVLSVLSLIPYTPLTFHAGEIAVAFDSILLSIALAEQIRRAQNEMLQAQKLARTDILTRLSNRLAFDEISGQIWNNAVQNDQDLCFLMLDIDHFKEINDNYGHHAGDMVLKTLSSILKKTVREGDVLVRWGGEEFAIILPQTSLQPAIKLAERIRKEIENLQIKTDGAIIKTTVSIGVSQKTDSTATIDELFSMADANLYKAKQGGRNAIYNTRGNNECPEK